jgi:flagellar protein FlaJ
METARPEPAFDPADVLAPLVPVADADAAARQPSMVSRVIYAALAVVPLFLGCLVLLARAGVITAGPRQTEAPWDLGVMVLSALVVLAVAIIVARRVPDLHRRSRNVAAMDHELAAWEMRVLVASLPLAGGLLAVAFLGWQGIVDAVPGARFDAMTPPLLSALGVLVACGPMGWFAYVRERHTAQLEERFPDFLRDLNESYGAGLTMAQAIRVAARGDYGKLNPEIRRMANQVSWGTPFHEALTLFADRVETPIVTRAVALINKATRAGGNTKDVLAAAARDAREIKALQQERKLSMTLYVIVIYVAFGVFLGVVAALQGLLVPALLQATQGVGARGLAGLPVATDVSFMDFRLIYFGVGLVQALGSGIVAGVMAEGSYAAGLKHGTILVLLTLLTLGLLG